MLVYAKKHIFVGIAGRDTAPTFKDQNLTMAQRGVSDNKGTAYVT